MSSNIISQKELMERMVNEQEWVKTPWKFTTLMSELSLLQQRVILMVSEVLQKHIKMFYDLHLDHSNQAPKALFSDYTLQNELPICRIWLQDIGILPSNYDSARQTIEEINIQVEHPEFDEQGRETGRTLRTNVFSQFRFEETGDWYNYKSKNGISDSRKRRNAYLDVKINPDVALWAFDMSKGYVTHLKKIAIYSSKRSTPRIYLLLKRDLPKNVNQIDIRKTMFEIKDYAGIKYDAYPKFSKFRKKILDEVQEDLDRMAALDPQITDITFTYEPIYLGHRHKGDPDAILFHVKRTVLGVAYSVVVDHAKIPKENIQPDIFESPQEPGLEPNEVNVASDNVWEQLKDELNLCGADVWFGNYDKASHTVVYVFDRQQPTLGERLKSGGSDAPKFEAIVRQHFGQGVNIVLNRQGK